MATISQLDQLEADARKRFNEKKAEGGVVEARINADTKELGDITQELARIQGEFRTIQNLRKQAEGSTLPTKKK
jgi:hypothetical protein